MPDAGSSATGGLDQSAPADTFTWSTKATTRVIKHFAMAGLEYVEGEHDGYTRLRQPTLAVWASPLRRCSEVAGQLALQTGAALRTDERLMEMDFGDWEGRAWEQIETEQPGAYQSWMTGWRHLAPPRGETLAVFEERVRSWLREQARCRELESSVLIGHAGVIRALRVLGGESSWDDALEKAIPHLVWLHVSISDGSRS